MSQRWLNFLERIGAPHGPRAKPEPEESFAGITATEWHQFRDHELLYRLYGPPPESPWYPYHCPTLFAAIDRLRLQPHPLELCPELRVRPPEGAWQWLRPGTMVLLDAPGAQALQMGASFLLERDCQLIATFDHWPRANPAEEDDAGPVDAIEPRPWPPEKRTSSVVIDSLDIIDAMVTMAPEVARRRAAGISPEAPPIWLCDARRMRESSPGPGFFDNRYFIDRSLLPTAERLSRSGIVRAVYVALAPDQAPPADLTPLLNQLHDAGIELGRVDLKAPGTWVEPIAMHPPAPTTLATRSFPRSAVGGFGREIPLPSESGSSSGGMAGVGGGG